MKFQMFCAEGLLEMHESWQLFLKCAALGPRKKSILFVFSLRGSSAAQHACRHKTRTLNPAQFQSGRVASRALWRNIYKDSHNMYVSSATAKSESTILFKGTGRRKIWAQMLLCEMKNRIGATCVDVQPSASLRSQHRLDSHWIVMHRAIAGHLGIAWCSICDSHGRTAPESFLFFSWQMRRHHVDSAA